MQLSPIIKKILSLRGYSTPDEINNFFSNNLKDLPDFSQLKDIEKTAQRIILALQRQEPIAIYGDYDVDGSTSCALLFHFFKLLGHEVTTYQPNRFIEGYGIHPPAILQAKADGIKVLITVDCGITNNEAAQCAQVEGIDLIITDHHTDANQHPPAAFAIVNPNRRDEPSGPMQSLAGVGVAFALAWQIKQLLGPQVPSIYPLLQFVAIGTICDLAKLNPMNLKLVRHGLHQLPQTKFAGLKVFLSEEERQFKFIPSEKLAFQIGPMINSKGRLGNPALALELLKTDDLAHAYHLHRQLEISNSERKAIQKEVFNHAQKIIMEQWNNNHLISIVYHPKWHEGVIGIVASKLVETFGVPAIVFTDTDDPEIIKASARSAGKYDLFAGLNEQRKLFTRFGGHKAAAGLSMPRQNLNIFIRQMNQSLAQIPPILRTTQHYFDLTITPTEITPELVTQLELLEPFGMGNEKPIFKLEQFKIKSFREVGQGGHIQWELEGGEGKLLRGISFNYLNRWNTPSPEKLFTLQQEQSLSATFTLGINRFRNREFLQLYITKIEPQ